MRIEIAGDVCNLSRNPFPRNIRRQPLIRLLPPLNTGLKSANKRTPASHQLHPTQHPLPQSGLHNLSCSQKNPKTSKLTSTTPCCHIFSSQNFNLSGLSGQKTSLSPLQPNVATQNLNPNPTKTATFCLLDSRNLPPWAISEPRSCL